MNMPGFTAEASLYRISSHSPGPRNHVLNAFGGRMSLIVPAQVQVPEGGPGFFKVAEYEQCFKGCVTDLGVRRFSDPAFWFCSFACGIGIFF